jgi:hypothetical protein
MRMTEDTTITAGSHPSPHAERVSLLVLAAILLVPPAAWLIDLFWKYAMTSYACFPGASALRETPPGYGWVWSSLLLVDVLALLATAGAAGLAFQTWSKVRREMAGHVEHLAEVGEGRTRFLALWGILIAALVVTAIVFSFVADVGLSLCA